MEGPNPTSALAIAAVVFLSSACGARELPPPVSRDGKPLAALDDSGMIARGRYLVNGPAHCVACHTPEGPLTEVDSTSPPLPVGGYAFSVPGGTVRAPNLTPDVETGIGRFTDEELVRVLRYGIKPGGRSLLPFMEYQGLSDEDIVAVLSYLRSLQPVRSEVRGRDINWFGRRLIGLFVKAKGPAEPPPRRVPGGVSVERGAYLANDVAMCAGCHTGRSSTGGYKGERFSGGFRMADELDPSKVLVAPNLTPDTASGHIVGWTEDDFVSRFREGRRIPGSPMPWDSYTLMSDGDLRSIYRYLMSLPPVGRDVGPASRGRG